jgi:hypothetical protein
LRTSWRQFLADTKIEANFPGAYKFLILLKASLTALLPLPITFVIAEPLTKERQPERFPLVKHKMHDHTA